jgi:hypothetical protein
MERLLGIVENGYFKNGRVSICGKDAEFCTVPRATRGP